MTETTEEKQERDTPRKVREDLTPRIEALEIGSSLERIEQLEKRINDLAAAIIESAHIMGWPKDLLEANGLKPFDKKTDKLSIKK